MIEARGTRGLMVVLCRHAPRGLVLVRFMGKNADSTETSVMKASDFYELPMLEEETLTLRRILDSA